MSKISNGLLDQYGKGQSFNGIGSKRVNIEVPCILLVLQVKCQVLPCFDKLSLIYVTAYDHHN